MNTFRTTTYSPTCFSVPLAHASAVEVKLAAYTARGRQVLWGWGMGNVLMSIGRKLGHASKNIAQRGMVALWGQGWEMSKSVLKHSERATLGLEHALRGREKVVQWGWRLGNVLKPVREKLGNTLKNVVLRGRALQRGWVPGNVQGWKSLLEDWGRHWGAYPWVNDKVGEMVMLRSYSTSMYPLASTDHK